MSKVIIGVFYTKKKGSAWKLLPKTSEELTDKQMQPFIGDTITSRGDDFKVIGGERSSFENLVTVQNRIFDYPHDGIRYDVALVCTYVPW